MSVNKHPLIIDVINEPLTQLSFRTVWLHVLCWSRSSCEISAQPGNVNNSERPAMTSSWLFQLGSWPLPYDLINNRYSLKLIWLMNVKSESSLSFNFAWGVIWMCPAECESVRSSRGLLDGSAAFGGFGWDAAGLWREIHITPMCVCMILDL